MDGAEDGAISGPGTLAGEPELLQPAARTSTAAAEIEKRAKRLFMIEPFFEALELRSSLEGDDE